MKERIFKSMIEKIKYLSLKNKKGKPTLYFKIQDREFNQPLTTSFNIVKANEFLRSLDSGIEIKFIDYKQYKELIIEVRNAIKNNYYDIDTGKTEKNYLYCHILERVK